jgi:hypothetical protein
MAILYTPNFNIQFNDANGEPLALGKVRTYINGSSTPATTYNKTGGVNPFPIILDPAGECGLRLDSANEYEIKVYDMNEVLIDTYPNVTFVTSGGGTGNYLPNSGNNTYTGNLTITGSLDVATLTVSGAPLSNTLLPIQGHAARSLPANTSASTGPLADTSIIDDLASASANNIPSGAAVKTAVDAAAGTVSATGLDTPGSLSSKVAPGTGILIEELTPGVLTFTSTTPTPTDAVTGSGTIGSVPRFVGAKELGDSSITEPVLTQVSIGPNTAPYGVPSAWGSVSIGEDNAGGDGSIAIGADNNTAAGNRNVLVGFTNSQVNSNGGTVVGSGNVITAANLLAGDATILGNSNTLNITGASSGKTIIGNGVTVQSSDPSVDSELHIGTGASYHYTLHGKIRGVDGHEGVPGEHLIVGADGQVITTAAGSQLSFSTGINTWTAPVFTIASATSVSIGAMTGNIVSETGVITDVTYAGGTVTDTFVGTSTNTYYTVDSTGAIVQRSTYPTPTQARSEIYLGFTAHAPVGTITVATAEPALAINEMSQVRDVLTGAFPLINKGILVQPNGANLNLNRVGGTLYGLGIGFSTSQTQPSSLNIPSSSAFTFQYRTQTGNAGGNTTVVDCGFYDNAGTRTSMPNNRWTNQRVYQFPSGLVRLQYGQTVYTSFTTAVAGAQTETFIPYAPFAENAILIGIICMQSNGTSLTSANTKFIPVSSLGEQLNGGQGLSTIDLQGTYNNSVTPEIVTDTTRGAFSVKRGTAADTDVVFEVLNGAGSDVVVARGTGDIDLRGNLFVNKTTTPLLTVGGNTSTSSNVYVNAQAGENRGISLQTAGVNRWMIRTTNAAESTGDAGCGFELVARTDAGGLIDSPITITRAAGGVISVTRPLSIANVTTPLVTIGSNSSTNPTLLLNGLSTTDKTLAFRSGSANRFSWVMSEATGESDSLLKLISYENSGVNDNPITIARLTTGIVNINRSLALSGDLTTSKVAAPRFTFGANTSTDVQVRLNGAAAQNRSLFFQTAGGQRWSIAANATAESGTNAGSNFEIKSYADDGVTALDSPFSITRANSGVITMRRNVQLDTLIYSNNANGGIFGYSNDGADGFVVSLSSTTGQSPSRGGYISVKGNEVASTGGDVLIEAGQGISGYILLRTGGLERVRIKQDGNIDFTVPSTFGINAYVANTSNISWNTLVTGDTFGRTTIYPEKIEFGPGTGARDTNLYRSAAGTLKTDGVFAVTGRVDFQAAQTVAVLSVATAAGTTTGAATDYLVVFTGATTQTYTMPAASTGRKIIVKNRSTGVVTVNRAGSDTLDGGTTGLTLATNQSLTFVANGIDWCII